MKPKSLASGTAIVLVFLTINIQAQNWSVFDQQDTINLQNNSPAVYQAARDSVKTVGAATTSFLMYSLDTDLNSGGCETVEGASFLGRSIHEENNQIRFCFLADTLVLTRRTSMYNVFQGDSLVLAYQGVFADTTHTGIFDSLEIYDIQFVGTRNFFSGNGYRIVLSKSSGIQEFPLIFKLLPMWVYLSYPGQGQATRVNYNVLSKGEVYNYSIGDVFHRRVKSELGSKIDWIEYQNITVVNRIDSNGAMYYAYWIKKERNKYTYAPFQITTTVSSDTVLATVAQLGNPIYQSLTYSQRSTGWYLDYVVWLNQSPRRVKRQAGDAVVWYPCIGTYLDVDQFSTEYGEGLGLIYNYSADCDAGYCDVFEEKLIYASTANTTFGSPYYIGIEEVSLENTISFHPNPVTSRLTIKASVENIPIDWQILDLSGRVVLKGKLVSATEEIDLDYLATGAYFFQTNGGIPQKLVKL